MEGPDQWSSVDTKQMHLIFSRKGFDSQYGGVPSPIFPDGSVVSLPIPSQSDARCLGDMHHGEINIGDIAADLTGNRINRKSRVHFDPDLYKPALDRSPGWRPAFGQVAAAQTHLANHCVGRGDLFLFFGWFRRVDRVRGSWRYISGSPDCHSIFGWLQIGDVVNVNEVGKDITVSYPWLLAHPHIESSARFVSQNNTIYLGSETLHFENRSLPVAGGGVFREFLPALCLTAEGRTRSLWRLPAWFYPEGRQSSLSYHGNPSRWTRKGDSVMLQTVAKGQEFVLNCEHYPEAVKWLEDFFSPLGNLPDTGAA